MGTKGKKLGEKVLGIKKIKHKLNTTKLKFSKIKANNKSKKRKREEDSKERVVTRRQGGGTLIESRPVFSADMKYIYANCGWGLRAFSVKTGESVRIYDALIKNGNVVAIFLYNNLPTALASDGSFISWEAKSGKVSQRYKIKIPKNYEATNAHLVRSLNRGGSCQDLCITVKKSNEIVMLFFNPVDGKQLQHPLNNTVVLKGSLKEKYKNSMKKYRVKHNLSFGGLPEKSILAFINKGLHIYSLNGKERIQNLLPSVGRSWTCVRCHPTEEIVAVGDNTGRVVVYTYPLSKTGNNIPTAVYHWHTLPCQEIAFSPAGSAMYTGGGENVLVKWSLDNSHIKYFLPRLSADIVLINVSPNNQLVAVATIDNAIQLAEPPLKLKCVLQQLAWGIIPNPLSSLFPAGIVFDPRTRALALNGRPGHLQFYSPLSEAILFNIDVTLQNYLTQERNKMLVNTEVTHVAISCDGAWLATIETRDDPSLTIELRLKFWQYINNKKCFSLNTSIELPHDGKVNSIIFRPGSNKLSNNDEINLDYLLVTTGTDNKFRSWTPRDLDSIYRNGVTWGCENTCYYRNFECTTASFSEDGSVIAVGFGPSITIWDIDYVQLKESLTIGDQNIKLIAFGKKESCHLLVSTTEEFLFVWNLLTLRLTWKTAINISILVTDPCSIYMAAFSSNNELFVFTPASPEPVYKSNQVCKRNVKVLSAIFMPRERQFLEAPNWLQHSLLYYIDTNQELMCFESEEERGEISMLKLAHDNDPGTLFSALVAAQVSKRKVTKAADKPLNFGVLGAAAVTQLLQAPAHTMPSVSLLCSSLLQSLVHSKKTIEKREEKVKRTNLNEDILPPTELTSSSETNSDSDEQVDEENNEEQEIVSKRVSKINTTPSTTTTTTTNEWMNFLDDTPLIIQNTNKHPESESMELDDGNVDNQINKLLNNVDNSDGLFVIEE